MNFLLRGCSSGARLVRIWCLPQVESTMLISQLRLYGVWPGQAALRFRARLGIPLLLYLNHTKLCLSGRSGPDNAASDG